MRIGGDSFGNADAQLCCFSLCDRAGFAPIKPKGIDQGVDDLLLGLEGPGHASELGGNGIGLLHPLGKSAPVELALGGEMPSQVPGVPDDADASVK